MYKSTHDSKNLGSLGCGMLTIALPQQLLFVCTCFQIAFLVLPHHISCELGKQTVVLPQWFSVVLETIQILLSFGMI